MLMDYYEMQKFFEWTEKNPVLLALTIFGIAALLIILIYASRREKKTRGIGRYSKKDQYNSKVSGEKK